MSHTVIGIFRHRHEADAAVEKLSRNNIDRANVDIAVPESFETRADISDDYLFDTPLGRYFKRIFADAKEARRYISVAQRSVTVAVQAATYDEAETIATLLDEAGALNIDEEARVMEDALTREERKYNIQAGRDEFNPDAKADSTTRESDNIAAETERQVPSDRRAATPLKLRTRIVEVPVGEKVRYREEQIWMEPRKHRRVDKQGNVHEPD